MNVPRQLAAIALAIAVFAGTASHAADLADACETSGAWRNLPSGARSDIRAVMSGLADKQVVLLGETHTRADHHHWQLHMLAALRAQRGSLAVGFEAFPRATQPVLDRWSADQLSARELLEQTDWRRIWNFDPDLYLPLFEFARMYRAPMFALNVNANLVRRVGREGWSAIPAGDREGLSDPAPALPAYEDFLWTVFQAHPSRSGTAAGRDDPAFRRFVEVQLTWDRAMAEAIATQLQSDGGQLVVGILGMGHLQEGWGVPHQLAAMGIDRVAVLLPWTQGQECDTLTATVADAVFVMRPPPAGDASPPPPRLGILIADSSEPKGVVVQGVSAKSVAEAAGLAKDDVIVSAAGSEVSRTSRLIAVVQRQAPGTWLPLTVVRDGERLDLIAKFPSSP